MLNIRFFASLRDLTGSSTLQIPLEGPSTVEAVFNQLASKYPRLKEYRPALLVAVNEEFASWDHPVNGGDELAFFPPVSGGLR